VFTIQKEIAETISRKLSVMISEDEKRAIRKVPTTRVEAYDCYLRGRQHFRQFRRKSIEVARAEFERAIEIDPEEPQVLYNVACVHTLQGLFDKALDCLAKTVAHGELWREWMRNDPDLESLHDHSRYRALAAGTESPS
jgi:tetratricopeptide (TPR) repeat protein